MSKLAARMRTQMSTGENIALLAALIVPPLVAVALLPLRRSFPATDAALVLAVVIVAVAANGHRVASLVATASVVLSFDLFLTVPRFAVAIEGTDARETAILLVVFGVLVTELAAIERRRRRAAERRFEVAFEQAGIGAGIIDLQGIPIRVNAAVGTLLGRPTDQLVGRNWDAYHHPDELPVGRAMQARGKVDSDTYSDERRFVRPDGTVVWGAFYDVLVRDPSGMPQYHLAQLLDITERKRIEEELAHQALHDALTGLPNRALLTDRLDQDLAARRRTGAPLGVIFLDVDFFKVVNDSLGHTAGDDLLRLVVGRITAAIRPGDTVARFGGDEFIVICQNATAEETARVAECVRRAIDEPWSIADQELVVTASLGIALADEQATSESLLRDSDAAMHQAKGLGRNRVEFFDQKLRTRAERRLDTAAALRRALENGEFLIYYQPIIDLDSGAMVGAEALLRWDRPDFGLVAPNDFIPIAEEFGLIIPIGAWVLEEACRQLVCWQRRSPAMSVAVNLSVRQVLSSEIVPLVEGILRRTGACPERVCLELTESVFMDDVEYFGRTLTRLKALGVVVSIDDFGTGYSSLSYLKQFPVDEVKVDRTFIDGLGNNTHDTSLVAALIAMADALDLEVTAEGIETRSQLALLKKLECHRGQGFFLARPMPSAKMDELVAQGHRWDID